MLPHRFKDYLYPTTCDLGWSPRLREIVSDLVCINCYNSCYLLTKLLVPVDSSLVLAIVKSNSLTVAGCGQVFFIQVTSSNRWH